MCVSLFVFTTPTPFSGNRSVLLSVFIALGFILRISSHRTFDPVVAPLPRGLLARFRFCDWTHNIFIWLLFSFLSLFRWTFLSGPVISPKAVLKGSRGDTEITSFCKCDVFLSCYLFCGPCNTPISRVDYLCLIGRVLLSKDGLPSCSHIYSCPMPKRPSEGTCNGVGVFHCMVIGCFFSSVFFCSLLVVPDFQTGVVT